MNQDGNQQAPRKKIPILLILLITVGACLFLTKSVNITHKSTDEIQSKYIEVTMAKTTLPAGMVITYEHINTEMVSRDELPPRPVVNPTQIIGRVLAMPVFEGQILTKSCFVPLNSGAQLAAQIPPGNRAVTVPVSSKSMPDRASLYPGCVVDVVAVYRLSGQDSLYTIKLRGIQVIAVDNETIVSNNENEKGDETKPNRSSRGSSVTLLVTTKLAEGLQLAIENGSISLSLRNPLEKASYGFQYEIITPAPIINGRTVQTISIE